MRGSRGPRQPAAAGKWQRRVIGISPVTLRCEPKRASKGDGPGASTVHPLRGRFAATSGRRGT